MSLHRLLDVALPGATLARATPLHGGDLSEVLRADLSDGRTVVLKRGARVSTEARMLRALAKAGAAVPPVLGVTEGLLVLGWLPPAPATQTAWRGCGAALRRVHDTHGGHYGWGEDYAFGPVAIPNAPLPDAGLDWPAFWAARRILPSVPHTPAALAKRLESLTHRLPDLLPHRPAPALLHGDLWTGNIHFSDGTGVLIDPASYYGHAEVDLAMLDLFGSLSDGFRAGYGPIDPGYDERRPIYQIWPALVHVRLFGSSYHRMLEGLLDRCGV